MANNKIEIDLLANDKASGALQGINDRLNKVSRSAIKAQSSIGRIKGFAKIGGIIAGAYKMLLKPLAERENYIAGIKTVAVNQEDYAKSLEYLNEVSKTLPFQMKELAKSFTFFRKKGIDPLRTDIMQAVSDTAAALGQDFGQVSNTLGHVMLGEYGYLKNIGMAARQNGNGVDVEYYNKYGKRHIYMFSDKNNRKAIVDVLLKGLQHKYSGASANAMDTLSGSITRLSNSFNRFIGVVADSSAFDSFRLILKSFADLAESVGNNAGLISTLKFINLLLDSLFTAVRGFFLGISKVAGVVLTGARWLHNLFDLQNVGDFKGFDRIGEAEIKSEDLNRSIIDLKISLPNGVEAGVIHKDGAEINETLIYGGNYGNA